MGLDEMPTNEKIVTLFYCIRKARIMKDYADLCLLGDDPETKLDELENICNECYDVIVMKKSDSKEIVKCITLLDSSLQLFPEFKIKVRSA